MSHLLQVLSFDAVQSAYRRKHSTERALLKITNDIYSGFDTHQSTILAALDQSAAFDCIDHEIMISRLQHTFGVTDLALSWFVSYFAARSMSVRRCGISSAMRLRCPAGVSPRTSVLQSIRGPSVMRDLLTTHNPSRNLRSFSQHLLSVGYMRTALSSRCFKHSAAINWNNLPFDIRACNSVNVFKRKLKTHLFNIAYAT